MVPANGQMVLPLGAARAPCADTSALRVMAAGGRRWFRALRESYQHADEAGMLNVVESAETRPKSNGSGLNEAQENTK